MIVYLISRYDGKLIIPCSTTARGMPEKHLIV